MSGRCCLGQDDGNGILRAANSGVAVAAQPGSLVRVPNGGGLRSGQRLRVLWAARPLQAPARVHRSDGDRRVGGGAEPAEPGWNPVGLQDPGRSPAPTVIAAIHSQWFGPMSATYMAAPKSNSARLTKRSKRVMTAPPFALQAIGLHRTRWSRQGMRSRAIRHVFAGRMAMSSGLLISVTAWRFVVTRSLRAAQSRAATQLYEVPVCVPCRTVVARTRVIHGSAGDLCPCPAQRQGSILYGEDECPQDSWRLPT